tara:strand:- start:4354 stop:5838 length:1485 start_codon:yes stop_codon:yes gene_type:complete
MSIAAIIATLKAPATNLFSDAQRKGFGIDDASLKRVPLDTANRIHIAICMANNVPYEELRKTTCVFLGLERCPATRSYAVTLLINCITRDDVHLASSGSLDGRFDIGVALHHLRENALVHKWHLCTYKSCLSSYDFRKQIAAAQRVRTGRESEWVAACRSSPTQRRDGQVVFAKSILHALQHASCRQTRSEVRVPTYACSDKAWIAFSMEIASTAGYLLLCKIGIAPDECADALHKSLHIRVGEQTLPPILRAYLQICDVVDANVANHHTVANALGMMIMYDIFVLSYDRMDANSEADVFLMLCQRMASVRYAFDIAADAFTRTDEDAWARNDEMRRSEKAALQMIEDEERTRRQSTQRRAKRNDKKRRRRQTRSRVKEEVDNIAASYEQDIASPNSDAPTAETDRTRRVDVPVYRADATAEEDGEEDDEGVPFDDDVASTSPSNAATFNDDDEQDLCLFDEDDADDALDRIMLEQTLEDIFEEAEVPPAVTQN